MKILFVLFVGVVTALNGTNNARFGALSGSAYIGGGANNPWSDPQDWAGLSYAVCWPYSPAVSSSRQACIQPMEDKKVNWKTLTPNTQWLLDVGAGAQMSPWNPTKFKNIEEVLTEAKSVGYSGISYDVEYISPQAQWGTDMCGAWNTHFQKVKAANLTVHVTNAWTSMWTTAGSCNPFCDTVMKCILKSDYVDIISPQIYCNGPSFAGQCDYSNAPKPYPPSLTGSAITWADYIAAANPKTKIAPVLTMTCKTPGSIYSNIPAACAAPPAPYKTFTQNVQEFKAYFCKTFGSRWCDSGFFWYPYFTA